MARSAATQPTRDTVKRHGKNMIALRQKVGFTPAGMLDVVKIGNDLITVYNTELQGFDSDSGRYTVVCETHGETMATDDLSMAKWLANNPSEVCEQHGH